MSIRQSDTVFPQGVNQRRDCPRHIRNWKQEMFDVFKNCTGEVTSKPDELSHCRGGIQLFAHRRSLAGIKSGSTYVITPSPVYTSLLAGYRFVIKADSPNDANPTITVNNLDPVSLTYPEGTMIGSNFIEQNTVFEIIYDDTDNTFKLLKS